MGNSEVGHTNLGAGRIVYQDLVRINRAVEDGSFFQNDALLLACRRAKAPRRRAPPHGAGLRRRRPLQPGAPLRLPRAGPARGGGRAASSTPSWTAATRRPSRASSYMRAAGAAAPASRLRPGRHRPRPLLRHGPRQALGPGGARPTPPWCAARATAPAAALAAVRGVLRPRRDRRVRQADRDRRRRRQAGRPGPATATRSSSSTSAPTGPARSPGRWPSPAFKEFERPVVPQLSAYVCMTQYDETFTCPVAFPPQSLERDLPGAGEPRPG